MNTEQLPDGLQLAIQYCRIGTTQDLRNFAVEAIRSEHAQRLTLQHHAADQAQRIAELEAERDELRARLVEIEEQEPSAWRIPIHTGEPDRVTYTPAPPAGWLLRIAEPLYAHPVPAIPDGWQPIETAPKDGSNVLVCAAGAGSDVSYFLNGHWVSLGIDSDEAEHYIDGYLTHWMPLPAAPEAAR